MTTSYYSTEKNALVYRTQEEDYLRDGAKNFMKQVEDDSIEDNYAGGVITQVVFERVDAAGTILEKFGFPVFFSDNAGAILMNLDESETECWAQYTEMTTDDDDEALIATTNSPTNYHDGFAFFAYEITDPVPTTDDLLKRIAALELELATASAKAVKNSDEAIRLGAIIANQRAINARGIRLLKPIVGHHPTLHAAIDSVVKNVTLTSVPTHGANVTPQKKLFADPVASKAPKPLEGIIEGDPVLCDDPAPAAKPTPPALNPSSADPDGFDPAAYLEAMLRSTNNGAFDIPGSEAPGDPIDKLVSLPPDIADMRPTTAGGLIDGMDPTRDEMLLASAYVAKYIGGGDGKAAMKLAAELKTSLWQQGRECASKAINRSKNGIPGITWVGLVRVYMIAVAMIRDGVKEWPL